ncbi:unnamed protein product [Gongylonema pulchrum]|uniref:Uncharacterized protein n=1 Tax=Gongylonema pulchrum TaxID=637853 RepID=A0A183CUS0_9BILA|nr:unnamed protein product [Gongylonema pulchrum]
MYKRTWKRRISKQPQTEMLYRKCCISKNSMKTEAAKRCAKENLQDGRLFAVFVALADAFNSFNGNVIVSSGPGAAMMPVLTGNANGVLDPTDGWGNVVVVNGVPMIIPRVPLGR